MQIQLSEYFYFNLVVIICYLGFPGSSVVKNPHAMQETLVQFLGWKDTLPVFLLAAVPLLEHSTHYGYELLICPLPPSAGKQLKKYVPCLIYVASLPIRVPGIQ